ncbi:Chaperone protein dnaJ 6 [Acorus calamus]|uniref:Chaperone protein dnaJ 6 n=1 Tax=Acorus calamus TaxID=4465 RepID=A0AAV9C093_ACOCL|nr:Chaperone protein dnaJ 6 [Acorus calamus]
MQAFLLGPSGPTGGGGGGGGERGLFRRHLKPPIFLGRWRPLPANHSTAPVTAAAVTNDGYGEDHYSVLGLPRRASSADVKKAYRLLALKYHPDVSKDMQAGEIFKSIRQAYEVLSNEATRAQYDWELQTQEETFRTRHRNWTSRDQSEKKRRKRRWAEVRHRVWYEEHYDENPYYSQTSTYRETTQDIQRGSFLRSPEVLFLYFLPRTNHRLILISHAVWRIRSPRQRFGCRVQDGLCYCMVFTWSRRDSAYVIHIFCELAVWEEQ